MRFKQYLDQELDMFFIHDLNEGVHDPGIFKAIFMAGGPGSGKSYVASKTTGGHGLKMVNSDIFLEKLAKKLNIKLDRPLNQITIKKLKRRYPEKIGKEKTWDAELMKWREIVKASTKKQMETFYKNHIGVVIDGTGRRYDGIKRKKDMLENVGYDTYMIFVNTSLDVAIERDLQRERSVIKLNGEKGKKMITDFWKSVQDNMGKFQRLFGKENFAIVDNNVYAKDDKIFQDAWVHVMKFARSPIKNKRAKDYFDGKLMPAQIAKKIANMKP